eukprot:9477820-Pyramimonas_sp.AAC.1
MFPMMLLLISIFVVMMLLDATMSRMMGRRMMMGMGMRVRMGTTMTHGCAYSRSPGSSSDPPACARTLTRAKGPV